MAASDDSLESRLQRHSDDDEVRSRESSRPRISYRTDQPCPAHFRCWRVEEFRLAPPLALVEELRLLVAWSLGMAWMSVSGSRSELARVLVSGSFALRVTLRPS